MRTHTTQMCIHKMPGQETGKLTLVESAKKFVEDTCRRETFYHAPFYTFNIMRLSMNYLFKN